VRRAGAGIIGSVSGVGKGIEQKLEGLVEGFFTKVFRSGLQPVEVGKRIVREMGDGRTVSVNRTYAPNEFRVFMGSDDHERFLQMEGGLKKEFSEVVIEAAKDNRWNLMGLPEITFEEVDGYVKGEFKVEASFASAPEEQNRVSTHEPKAGDPQSTGAISFGAAKKLGIAAGNPQLLLLDDAGNPSEKISLTKQLLVIGRMSSNDIVISDANISRRHAELRKDGSRWVLKDLGSTNGTVVNGKLASEHALKDGDRLTFGTSELVFKEATG
jgi:hypothetical protein